jgi:membrane protein DedA with SNARE-associated domain
VARFVTGLRNVAGLVAGASGMAPVKFVAVTAAAALTWSLVNALEYYWFGRALAGADTWVQIALIAAGLVWMVVSLRLLARRAIRRLDQAPVSTGAVGQSE